MNTNLTIAPRGTRRRTHRGGLRMVAVLEALKGALALVAAYIVISMIHRDVDFESAAENILFFLHLNPGHRLSQAFLNAADKMSDVNVMLIAGLAGAYAFLRFLEGYGLWKQRAWAEWLAIISGCIYIPFEVYKVVRHPNEFHWALLGINILVVLYIAWVRWDEITAARRLRSDMSTESS
jgi:uncharacterized membrane protein (DUF2068 family)